MVRKKNDPSQGEDNLAKAASPLQVALTSALKSSVRSTLKAAQTDPGFLLETGIRAPQEPPVLETIRRKEVACARLFNFELPEDIPRAVDILEETVSTFTRTRKNLILIYDETAGIYSCLNDERFPHRPPREIQRISDRFLQELLGSENVLHTYLFSENTLLGIVAVADRRDDVPFDEDDELGLEIAAQYLATKLISFRNLKQSLMLSMVQRTVLEVSSQLITAVDQEAVLAITLESFGRQMGFDLGQYIHPSMGTPSSGQEPIQESVEHPGEVLLEYQHGRLKSFMHAGLKSKRKTVPDYPAILSLFTSAARTQPYLHIPGSTLGSKTLYDIFSLPHSGGASGRIQSALILPITDPATGRIRGLMNLYRTDRQFIGPETLDVAREVVALVSLALSRVTVLEKALAMASTDELTGLTNRRGFYERFEVEIERARRNQTSLCVAMLDVDFFKPLNDAYGHLNGDAVLKGLAGLFAQSFRKSDLVCRFGGEEFAILLPDTSFKDALELMERIRKKVETTVFNGVDGRSLGVTVSLGLTPVNTSRDLGRPSPEVISEALALADEQLYRAKEGGRNRVCANLS